MLEIVERMDNLDDLFGYFSPGKMGDPKKYLDTLDTTIQEDAYGGSYLTPVYNEFNRPYLLYNWELGFHALMVIADRLLQNQQFDLPLKMMHYIFHPSLMDQANSKHGSGNGC